MGSLAARPGTKPQKVADQRTRYPSGSLPATVAAPSTAYLYNWNMLPIGQMLWLKELESYVAFPPMQDPASYNLTQVIDQIRKQGHRHPSE
jgi:hypothetical protein